MGELREFSYYPGYSDMRGAYHYSSLKKDENGKWVIISSDRKSFDDALIVTTYAVSSTDVLDFEAFLKDKDILLLTNREDSDDFITDYSPWGCSIVFDKSSGGGSKYETYSISQYKEYSDNDRKLLDELNARFLSLQGKIISEVV